MHMPTNAQRVVGVWQCALPFKRAFKGFGLHECDRSRLLLPDWVEHVLETDAEPYLRTPEEELSFITRHNMDVNACIAGASFGMLYVLWRIGQLAGRNLFKRNLKVKDK